MIYSTIDETEFQQMQKLKDTQIEPKRISVVMPFYNNWGLTHQRLMDLWKHVNPYEIVLVNDASTEEVNAPVASYSR